MQNLNTVKKILICSIDDTLREGAKKINAQWYCVTFKCEECTSDGIFKCILIAVNQSEVISES